MHIIIDKLVHGGNGIGEIDGKKVFVPYSAPGDELEIAVGSDRLDFANAHIEKIIKPAACRVVPKCPVFGICGGCQWQHIGYETQLECKRDILKEALWRIGKMEDVEILPTLASPKIWNYRNRIQLHVSKEGKIGFYRPKSKEIVEFE